MIADNSKISKEELKLLKYIAKKISSISNLTDKDLKNISKRIESFTKEIEIDLLNLLNSGYYYLKLSDVNLEDLNKSDYNKYSNIVSSIMLSKEIPVSICVTLIGALTYYMIGEETELNKEELNNDMS